MAKLTMALSHYDRHIPFFDGSVDVDGVDLEVLEVGQSDPLKHGRDRHERMLQKAEFDICEANVGAYFMERDHGVGLTSIPVFLHRRFRHGFIFINTTKGIKKPSDLIWFFERSTSTRL